ncbi:helix-turn-helix transcriptional regulator [Erythrobacter colymbi]|uniref:helix-turn-helix transcriptional regulator n=1 Tax=Erythrobacter colymbi TaxID=1161202 RepID=UPI00138FA6F7|nr:helix-turn-helix transcriptional regulator [Erythrobacter colymbi]
MNEVPNPLDRPTRDLSGLAHRLKCARVSLELTQEQLAARLGIARQTLNGYEQGHTDPPASLLAQLCDDYAFDPVWLLLGHQPTLMIAPYDGTGSAFQGSEEKG